MPTATTKVEATSILPQITTGGSSLFLLPYRPLALTPITNPPQTAGANLLASLPYKDSCMVLQPLLCPIFLGPCLNPVHTTSRQKQKLAYLRQAGNGWHHGLGLSPCFRLTRDLSVSRGRLASILASTIGTCIFFREPLLPPLLHWACDLVSQGTAFGLLVKTIRRVTLRY